MQRTMLPPSLAQSDFDANPTFNVVIAYEDFDTGKQAKRTYDYLAQNLGGDCEFANQMWKFDVLAIPKLREMAAKDAAASDIVIISCRAGRELPGHVRAWIESWLAEPAKPIALVALFDGEEDDSLHTQPLRDFLRGVAQRGGMEFFAQPEPPVRKRVTAPLAALAGRTQAAMAGQLQRDVIVPRWGINE